VVQAAGERLPDAYERRAPRLCRNPKASSPLNLAGYGLRLAWPGAMSHTTGRGNARAAIYADAADRGTFLIRENRGQRILFSEAVWKQSLYTKRGYVIYRARLRTDLLDNRSLGMLLEISKGLIY